MAKHRSFIVTADGLTAAKKMAIELKVEALRTGIALAKIRQPHQITREALSGNLCIGQAAIAQLVKRTDLYIGNLQRFIKVTSGELAIFACYPDGEVAE